MVAMQRYNVDQRGQCDNGSLHIHVGAVFVVWGHYMLPYDLSYQQFMRVYRLYGA